MYYVDVTYIRRKVKALSVKPWMQMEEIPDHPAACISPGCDTIAAQTPATSPLVRDTESRVDV